MIASNDVKVVYSDKVFAKNREGVVLLHPGLREFPKLEAKVLWHEQSHTNSLVAKKDVLLELQSFNIFTPELLYFFAKYPKALVYALLPFSIAQEGGRKTCYIDWFMMLLWIVPIILFCSILMFFF